ncbi:hypothetical protein SCLARK_00411 [Spiroplasma clarkii]|uniref:Uncharacterized protein n=1 Tax=Spiroplasma clarkii TaxID=2139 RepID=A0A1Y0KZI0_9MOLU|nr:hypothetical protein [Spiroplasma clarkii]ARU91133.1 hypothetical protein SCLARK_00411 [Spiroplasma clarkii]ATX70577.1 hypothetical protein SCLAR_v1c02470 [Spiroplasma clarkii]
MKLEEKIAKYHLEDLIDFKQLKAATRLKQHIILTIAFWILSELGMSLLGWLLVWETIIFMKFWNSSGTGYKIIVILFISAIFLLSVFQICIFGNFLKSLIQGEHFKKNQKLKYEVKKIDTEQIYNNILKEILGEKSSSFLSLNSNIKIFSSSEETYSNQEFEKYKDLKRVFEINNQKFVLAFYLEKAKLNIFRAMRLVALYLTMGILVVAAVTNPAILSRGNLTYTPESWKKNWFPIYGGTIFFKKTSLDQDNLAENEFTDLNAIEIKKFKVDAFRELGPRFILKKSILKLIKNYETEILTIKEIVNL